jgi:predicted nucleic acid-binding Zn ribbon protein
MSQQPSGVDLARTALLAARAAAKTRTAQPERKKTRTTRARSRSHGDPMGLGAAITTMMTERGWEPPAAGGSVIDQWPAIAPELADKVHPVRYEHETGILHLRPVSPAYATQLRLYQTQILAKVQQHPAGSSVRALKVLPAGAAPTAAATAEPETPAAKPEPGPVRTRETASPGYRATLEATLTHRPEKQPTDPYILEAIRRQEAALRANRQPASEDREAMWAAADAPGKPKPGSVEASLRAARAFARRERAGLAKPHRDLGAA